MCSSKLSFFLRITNYPLIFIDLCLSIDTAHWSKMILFTLKLIFINWFHIGIFWNIFLRKVYRSGTAVSRLLSSPKASSKTFPTLITVHTHAFILISTMWSKDKYLEIQMVKRISRSASSNNCLHWRRKKFASWNKKKL